MKIKILRIAVSVGLLLGMMVVILVLQACDLISGETTAPPGADLTQTALVRTMTAMQAQLQVAQSTLIHMSILASVPPLSPTDSPIPTWTNTPTWTPTWTPTSTPLPTDTPKKVKSKVIVVTATTGGGGRPKIYATINSNCRDGPSKYYRRLGYLLVGEVSEVYGRDRSGYWWYIREPRRGFKCWVWSGSTQVQGNTNKVPIITPYAVPLTKTAAPGGGSVSFSIQGIRVVKCGGQFTVNTQVKNNGKRGFESAWLRITNQTKNKKLFGPDSSNTPFRSSFSDCTAGGDYLDAGKTLYVGAGVGSKKLTGDRILVEIKMCTGEGLSGVCTSRSATYKVP